MLTNKITGEVLKFSLISEEEVEWDAEVTKEPTEEGYEISDGILNKNTVLKIKGKNGVINFKEFGGEITRVSSAISILTKWKTNGDILVYSWRNGFDRCVIINFKIKQTNQERYGWNFDLELEQIRTVGQIQTKVTGKTKPDGIIAKKIAEKEKKAKKTKAKRKTTTKKKSNKFTLTDSVKKEINEGSEKWGQ